MSLSWYSSLPSPLLKCIEEVAIDYRNDEKVLKEMRRLEKDYGTEIIENKEKTLFNIAVFIIVSIKELLLRENYTKIICYDRGGKSFNLGDLLCYSDHMILRSSTDSQLVVKWFRRESLDISYEINIYKKLQKMGCPLPEVYTDYRVWNKPVLVMERLEELNGKEDYCSLGIQILDQLEHLHSFGVHNDIKPSNILKKDNNYFLIDYGGVATKPLENGYLRWNWSHNWTSQKIHGKKQVTTPRNDFIELGYTMNAVKNYKKKSFNARQNFSGKLEIYMEYVRRIDPLNISPHTYKDLKNILRGV